MLDEVALDVVLSTLDTAADFIRYLGKRKQFFCRHKQVEATGEEDLLAFYFLNENVSTEGYDFPFDQEAKFVGVDESYGRQWTNGWERPARDHANRISYCWDQTIQEFVSSRLQRSQDPEDWRRWETSLRWMAREPRIRRRLLAETLVDMVNNTRKDQFRRRVVFPTLATDPLWVFLVFPRVRGLSNNEYQELRLKFLDAHCCVAKLLLPSVLDVVGMAVGTTGVDQSGDLLYHDMRNWSEAQANRARRFQRDHKVFENATAFKGIIQDFPSK